MNQNNNFLRSNVETLLMAIVIGILIVTAAKGESNFDFDVLNGLFTPTQSERFFQAGREDFERQEVEFLNHPEIYLKDDLLQIEPESSQQTDRYRHQDCDRDNVRYETHRDRNYK